MLEQRFVTRRAEGRTTLVMFLTAGDPNLETTLQLMHDLTAAGVDVIELGYPFSDPILDGPTLQRANRRALNGNGSLEATLDLAKRFRQTDKTTPIVLMGYYHPIVAFGVTNFVDRAAKAGIDGLIVADLPYHHAKAELLPLVAETEICLIPLAAPMLSIEDIVDDSDGVGGFIYCIAAPGPTGGATPTKQAIADQVARCRSFTQLSVAVGFGIKNELDACMVAQHADGVVIASVLVDQIAAWLEAGVSMQELSAQVRRYVGAFRIALDRGDIANGS